MSTSIVPASVVAVPARLVPQADNDEKMIQLWLHGRSRNTQEKYEREARRMLASVQKPLAMITLGDLQAYADCIAQSGAATATQALALSAIKSLFSFGQRLGYLQFDTARVLRLPKVKNTLAERIMTEAQVQAMIAREDNLRNKTMLRLMYAAGVRVSEVCGLRWRDVQDRDNGSGQITVFGKGGKTRAIALPSSLWGDLVALRNEAKDDAPVFLSRKGAALDQSQINRIVHAAAKRAGVKKLVSPHWLRHAHASHAIDRGAPINLVQATLGHASTATTGRYLHARPADSSSRYLAI